MTTANEFLQNSDKLLGERGKDYDPNNQAERSMGKIVACFNTITGKELTEAEGWLFMTCLKQVRLFNKPGFHRDSAEDLISYAALLAEAKEQEA